MKMQKNPSLAQKNKRLVRWLVLGAIAMFGFGFALVPLYDVFCKATGINGKVDITQAPGAQTVTHQIDETRTVTLELTTTLNERLPWEFRPLHKKGHLHPGEPFQTAYFAKNLSDKTMTVQAIPSISPGKAAEYIKKLECFCFTQQVLGPHESTEMGVRLVIDPSIPKDIHTITLSYTLFDLTDPKAQEAQTHVHDTP